MEQAVAQAGHRRYCAELDAPILSLGGIVAHATWLTPFGSAWQEAFGTPVVPWGRLASALKPLVEARGESVVLLAWKRALAEGDDRKFFSPQRFAERFGDYAPPATDAFGYAVVIPAQAKDADRLLRLLSGDEALAAALAEAAGWQHPSLGMAIDWMIDRLHVAWSVSVEKYPGVLSAMKALPMVADAHEKLDAHLRGVTA